MSRKKAYEKSRKGSHTLNAQIQSENKTKATETAINKTKKYTQKLWS